MTEIPSSDFYPRDSDPAQGMGILVAFRDELARHGLESMLRSAPMVRNVASCRENDEAIRICRSQPVDVVILQCPVDDRLAAGIAATAALRGIKTLLLLDSVDLECVSAAAEARADGFLLRSELTVEFLGDTLSSLARGAMPLPQQLAKELLSRARTRGQERDRRGFMLTPREQQALDLLAEGLSNRQIARRLAISEHGAKRHVASVLAKLNCPNRTLAVALALREGLVVVS